MRKAILAVFLILIIFNWNEKNAFSWEIPGDITFIGLEKIIPDVKKTVFSVQAFNDNSSSGSPLGFKTIGSGLLVTANDNSVLGITCEHVIRKPLENKMKLYMGLNTEKGFVRYECNIVHTEKDKDIAILIPKKSQSSPEKVINLGYAKKHFSAKTEIIEGRGIIIIGYPLGYGHEYGENHPIVRLGIIAQTTGRDYFLIDATANQGYSGSPVFDIKNGKVSGMVQAYPNDYIDLFDVEQRHAARIPYNSGIGLVISADVLSQILSEHLGNKW